MGMRSELQSYILSPSTPPPLSSFLFPSFLLSYSLPLLLSSFPSSKHPNKIEDLNGQTTLLGALGTGWGIGQLVCDTRRATEPWNCMLVELR